MAILDRLLNMQATVPNPVDDFWYTNQGTQSLTGVRVTPEAAMGISTVYACVSAIAQDIGAMPLHLYRKVGEEDRERATNLGLYNILRRRPNQWQDAQEFYEMLLGHLLLRGNAYCIIQSGRSGFVDQLIPLNPARMKVEQLASNRVRYTYQWEDGTQEIFPQELIFHIRGLSSDGLVGLGVVTLAREAFGLGLAYEQYAARFFSQDATPKGALMLDGKLQDDQAERLERRWSAAHSGLGRAHRTAILESGLKWQAIGVSNEDSQFLQSAGRQVEEMARWFHMPLTRIGHTEKATSWGTGLEQFNIGYITYALRPWVRRIENRIWADLIVDNSGDLFAEFLMEDLLRGDTTTRYTAYGMGIRDGWFTRNEARSRENLNRIEGLDAPLVPQNMAMVDEDGEVVPLSAPPEPRPLMPPPQGEDGEEQPPPEPDARAKMLATQLASIAVRREITAVKKLQRRHEGEPDLLDDALTEFYDQHATLIAKDLCINDEHAGVYCGRQREHPEASEEDKIRELATLALGGIDG